MKVSFEKGEVVIRIPVTDKIIEKAPMSKSGKARLIASSAGFMAIEGAPEGVRLNLALTGKK